jgi:diguanylate cyclase (GGDEF)-like protein
MILMIDVNGLKAINDTYGHKKGSELLVKTMHIVCDICKHSPVFRIGGDEFVAILTRHDYNYYETILEKLRPYIVKRDMAEDEPYKTVAFSMGLAKFDSTKDHSYNDVFLRADEAMYKCKKRLKAGRED